MSKGIYETRRSEMIEITRRSRKQVKERGMKGRHEERCLGEEARGR